MAMFNSKLLVYQRVSFLSLSYPYNVQGCNYGS
jgi:hypothetical protein